VFELSSLRAWGGRGMFWTISLNDAVRPCICHVFLFFSIMRFRGILGASDSIFARRRGGSVCRWIDEGRYSYNRSACATIASLYADLVPTRSLLICQLFHGPIHSCKNFCVATDTCTRCCRLLCSLLSLINWWCRNFAGLGCR
jgi:hypothetical protein